MLGWIAAAYDYEWKEAERLFRSAMASNPVSPTVHWMAGHYLLSIGHFKPAIQEIELALEADPLNISYRRSRAFCMWGAGHVEDAAAQCRRNVEFDENEYWSYFLLSLMHAQRGDLEEAVQLARKAYSLAPWFLPVVATLAGLLTRTGDTSEAATILRKLGDGQAYGAPLAFVIYYLLCSQIDLAADWTEKAIEQRDAALTSYLQLPQFEELRRSSRWPTLAKMMNFPDVGYTERP
jgi:tetratricopeptide (TPR) repeat protein